MTKEEYIKAAIDSMIKGDEKLAVSVMNDAIADGVDAAELLSEGFSAGIREVGDQFGRGRMFLPELMLAADAMKAVSAIVEEEIAKKGGTAEKKGTMVLATVQGDVHDIGKGIVASLIKTQGVEVIDLGRDVPAADIVEKAVECGADLIGTSALLTTTMGEMKVLEELLKEKGLKNKFKTLVGGAPVTERFAKRIGADAYGEDASQAVAEVARLLS
ncbi:MAG: cobalamin B12-binding domain-containing protein [Bacillota bacterium]|jgi:trimethylamine corrinoid protein